MPSESAWWAGVHLEVSKHFLRTRWLQQCHWVKYPEAKTFPSQLKFFSSHSAFSCTCVVNQMSHEALEIMSIGITLRSSDKSQLPGGWPSNGN